MCFNILNLFPNHEKFESDSVKKQHNAPVMGPNQCIYPEYTIYKDNYNMSSIQRLCLFQEDTSMLGAGCVYFCYMNYTVSAQCLQS